MLASIIIVALRSVLLQVCDLPAFWRLSRADGALWICVFLSVVVIDIDYGLLIGFLLSAGRVFLQVRDTQQSGWNYLSVHGTDAGVPRIPANLIQIQNIK